MVTVSDVSVTPAQRFVPALCLAGAPSIIVRYKIASQVAEIELFVGFGLVGFREQADDRARLRRQSAEALCIAQESSQ